MRDIGRLNAVWVVEVSFAPDPAHGAPDWSKWQPTVGTALSRADGRFELNKWRTENCIGDRLRLRQYRRVE
jgi:hypothetical protein